jgi:hypothetical protein
VTRNRLGGVAAAACFALALVLAAGLLGAPGADGSGDGVGPGGGAEDAAPEGGRGDGGGGEAPDGDGSPGGGGGGEAPDGDGSPGGNAAPVRPPEYELSLDRRPVPGARVVVTVTSGGRPAEAASVLFNGRVVGTTNRTGRLTARVPYDPSLVVAAYPRPPTESRPGAYYDVGVDDAPPAATLVAGARSLADRRPARTGTGATAPTAGGRATRAGTSDRSTRTARTARAAAGPRRYPLNTSVAVRATGTPREGRPLRVRASIEGVPVREANVSLDGGRVARTDGSGTATVRVPHRERTRLAVDRGAARGGRTLEVKPWVNVTTAGVAVPGRPVTLEATRRGAPVPDATVRVDGAVAGTTGPDGRLRVRVPRRNAATFAVERGEAFGARRVGWLLGWYVLPVAVVTGAAGVVALVRVARDPARAATGSAVGLLVRAAAALVALGRALGRAGAALVGALRAVAGRGPPAVLAAVRSAPLVLARALVERLRRAWARVAAAVRPGPAAGPSPGEGDAGGFEFGGPWGVERAWREFLALVPVPADRLPTMTPGEVARAAVAAGLPPGPVERLLEAFRAVRYGGREGGGPAEAARAALDRLREDPDAGPDDPDGEGLPVGGATDGGRPPDAPGRTGGDGEGGR